MPANFEKVLSENQIVLFGASYNDDSLAAIDILKFVKCQMIILNVDQIANEDEIRTRLKSETAESSLPYIFVCKKYQGGLAKCY